MMVLVAQAGPQIFSHPVPVLWGLGLFLTAAGLWVILAGGTRGTRRFGVGMGGVGLLILAVALRAQAALQPWTQQIIFWLLAGTAVGGAAAAVTARNPVYTAIWFALSLLGVSGLFIQQHAEFLGVATIVVYAGAIIVTFLFVLMLAQPQGDASYDRMSWASFAPLVAVAAAAALVALVVTSLDRSTLQPAAASGRLTSEHHMAHLGATLFSRHLIAIEVAGTLLLVALVGAIAIVIHGRPTSGPATATDPAAGAPPQPPAPRGASR